MKIQIKRLTGLLLCAVIICGTLRPAGAAVKNYYGQLNQEQKEIYQELYEHFYEADESGCQLQSGASNEGNLEAYAEQYVRNVHIAYSALINDNPAFYWNGTLTILKQGEKQYFQNDWHLTKIYGFQLSLDAYTKHTVSEKNKFQRAFQKAVKKIKSRAGKKPSKIKLIKEINRWIGNQTAYVKKIKKNNQYIHNAYGVFVKKKAVCDGYSMAFKLLCDYFKIPCMVVYGYVADSSEKMTPHMWNIVRFRKKWYYVDTTWNDTGKSAKWLLCGTKRMKKTHLIQNARADILQEGVFSIPKISKKDYKKKAK